MELLFYKLNKYHEFFAHSYIKINALTTNNTDTKIEFEKTEKVIGDFNDKIGLICTKSQ